MREIRDASPDRPRFLDVDGAWLVRLRFRISHGEEAEISIAPSLISPSDFLVRHGANGWHVEVTR